LPKFYDSHMKYSIKAASMATGVTQSCLRTWERRYGIPMPRRTDSGRRLYSEADLAIVRRMSSLIGSGVSASEAAEAVRLEDLTALEETTVEEAAREHPLVDLFVQKAKEFDRGWLLRIVRDAVYAASWAPTLERVVLPALSKLHDEWRLNTAEVAPARFATELVRGELCAEVAKLAESVPSTRPVLAACPEGEHNDLRLLGLGLLLQRRDVPVIYLGASLPCSALIDAVDVTKPRALCLFGSSEEGLAGLHRAVRCLVGRRSAVTVFIGGTAATRENGSAEMPGILLPPNLDEAVERIAAKLSGD
jgi:DNA-binding transcriptional MerR regulator